MNQFAEVTSSGDASAAAELIVRRLAGDHLDSPIDYGAGEASRDIIKSFANSEPAWATIREALDIVAAAYLPEQMDGLYNGDDDDANTRWLLEFYSLIAETGYIDAGRLIERRAIELLSFVDASGPVRTVQLAAFRAIASLKPYQGKLARFIAPIYESIDAAGDLSFIASEIAPGEFLSVLSKHVLAHYADDEEISPDAFAFLIDSIRNAVSGLVATQVDPMRAGLDMLLKHAADKARHVNGPMIREGVVAAISQSPTLNAAILQQFEIDYWAAHKDAPLIPASRHLAALKTEIRTISKGKYRAGPIAIAINPLPYAEAAYFSLFRVAMRVGFDIDITEYEMKFDGVLSELIDNNIQLAVHNEDLLAQHAGGPMEKEILRSEPLIRFNKYEALASRSAMEKYLRTHTLSPGARTLAKRILEGDLIPNDQLDKVSLTELAQIDGLSYLQDTDTEFAARTVFHDSHRAVSLPPDQGLARLLDGGIGFYVGGALQTHYARRSCPDRVVSFAEIAKKTDVHFFVTREAYDERPQVYDLCVLVWRFVKQFWPKLVDPTLARDELIELSKELRQAIYLRLNRSSEDRFAFVDNFEDLANLLAYHDQLMDPFAAPTRYQAVAVNRRASLEVVSESATQKGIGA